jgi:hypothetical protein
MLVLSYRPRLEKFDKSLPACRCKILNVVTQWSYNIGRSRIGLLYKVVDCHATLLRATA